MNCSNPSASTSLLRIARLPSFVKVISLPGPSILCCSQPFSDGSEICMNSNPIVRSEEHTSELQSQSNLVCRLLLEKKKKLICEELSIFNHGVYRVHIAKTNLVSYALLAILFVSTHQVSHQLLSRPY